MLVLALGWSILYTLYRLVLSLVEAYGSMFLGPRDGWRGEHAVISFPGLGSSDSDRDKDSRKVRVKVNEVFYPVSYWSEKGGRPYQVRVRG